MAIRRDPPVFIGNMNPLNIRCSYSEAAQNLINGQRNTFGGRNSTLFGGVRTYASHQLRAFETRILDRTLQQYAECIVYQVNIASALEVFGEIWGGQRNIPFSIASLHRDSIVAIPYIFGHESANFEIGRYAGQRFDINAIHGLSMDREYNLYALYQVDANCMCCGNAFTNDNDPNMFTWDTIQLVHINERGQRETELLNNFWKHKLYQFIVQNQCYRFTF